MFSLHEQFSAATKANYEAQLAMINALTATALEGVAKVIDLNVQVAKAALAESTVATQKRLSAKDPQEWLSLATAHAQKNVEKALSHGRQVASIASGTQAEFTKTVEAHLAEINRNVMALVDDMTKNAPAGSESAFALMKTAIGNANAGYEQLTKTTLQAVGVLEDQLTTAANQVSQTVEKTASSATKK